LAEAVVNRSYSRISGQTSEESVTHSSGIAARRISAARRSWAGLT
jgi:hypothetical protein